MGREDELSARDVSNSLVLFPVVRKFDCDFTERSVKVDSLIVWRSYLSHRVTDKKCERNVERIVKTCSKECVM